MPDLTPNQIEKAELRAAALAKREAMPAQLRADAASAIAARDFPVPVAKGAIVSGFSPMKSEINPIPLMRKLFDAGAQLALPVFVGRGQPLIIRAG
jgi:5-formyltetrahydrofolate cyclo-ligase